MFWDMLQYWYHLYVFRDVRYITLAPFVYI